MAARTTQAGINNSVPVPSMDDVYKLLEGVQLKEEPKGEVKEEVNKVGPRNDAALFTPCDGPCIIFIDLRRVGGARYFSTAMGYALIDWVATTYNLGEREINHFREVINPPRNRPQQLDTAHFEPHLTTMNPFNPRVCDEYPADIVDRSGDIDTLKESIGFNDGRYECWQVQSLTIAQIFNLHSYMDNRASRSGRSGYIRMTIVSGPLFQKQVVHLALNSNQQNVREHVQGQAAQTLPYFQECVIGVNDWAQR